MKFGINTSSPDYHGLLELVQKEPDPDLKKLYTLLSYVTEYDTEKEFNKNLKKIVELGSFPSDFSHLQRSDKVIRRIRIDKLKDWANILNTEGITILRARILLNREWDIFFEKTPEQQNQYLEKVLEIPDLSDNILNSLIQNNRFIWFVIRDYKTYLLMEKKYWDTLSRKRIVFEWRKPGSEDIISVSERDYYILENSDCYGIAHREMLDFNKALYYFNQFKDAFQREQIQERVQKEIRLTKRKKKSFELLKNQLKIIDKMINAEKIQEAIENVNKIYEGLEAFVKENDFLYKYIDKILSKMVEERYTAIEFAKRKIKIFEQYSIDEKIKKVDNLINSDLILEAIDELKKIKIISNNNDLIIYQRLSLVIEQKIEVCKNELKAQKQLEGINPLFLSLDKVIEQNDFYSANSYLIKIKKNAQTLSSKKIKEKVDHYIISIIRKSILYLGTKFTRLHITEIAEECGQNEKLIIGIIEDMIKNKEIYAQYFSSTKSVAFDQQANINEIDNLMKAYKDWEDKKVGKK